MKYLLVFVVIFAIIKVSSTSAFIKEEMQNHITLAEASLFVTKRYISPRTNTIVIVENSFHSRNQTLNSRILDQYLQGLKGSVGLQLFLGKPGDQPWEFFVFIVDSYFSFRQLRWNIPHTVHERNFYFLIIITNVVNSNGSKQDSIYRILNLCWFSDIINVIVMIEEDISGVVFYSYKSYSPEFCDQIKIVKVNRYIDGHLDEDKLFPDVLQDFFNCSLTITARELSPFFIFNGDSNNAKHLSEASRRLSGIDGDLLKLLASSLNFNINLKSLPKEEGITYDNVTAKGCIVELLKGLAEISVGALSILDPLHQELSSSIVYHQSPYIFVVREGVCFGPLTQLANPLRASVWVLIATLLVAAVIFIKVIDIKNKISICDLMLEHKIENPILNLFASLLGYPINNLPKKNFARYILVMWLLFTFILRNVYQGSLFDSLRKGRKLPLPKRIAELQERNYILIASSITEHYPREKTIIYEENLLQWFMFIDYNEGRYASTSLIESLVYYNENHWNTSKLVAVEEPILTVPLVIYFPKYSTLKVPFDRKLKQLMAAGFTTQIINRNVNQNFYAIARKRDAKNMVMITRNLLTGLLQIYSTLTILAVVVFIFETMSRRIKCVRIFLNWMHYGGTP